MQTGLTVVCTFVSASVIAETLPPWEGCMFELLPACAAGSLWPCIATHRRAEILEERS